MQVYEKEFSISLTTRTGLVIKQSFEPRRIHSFPLLFLITAELVCERYAQLAETRVMVGYILRLEADARRNLPGLEYIVAIQIQDGLYPWQSHSARRHLHCRKLAGRKFPESLCCAQIR